MTTLAIETSTGIGSIALIRGGEVLFSEQFPAERTLGSHLFATLQRVLDKAAPLEQIAVGLGPGSYAGVRIAISAATGLALAAGAKLVGLPSFVAFEGGDYLAVGDARRDSFYYARVSLGECLEGPLLLGADDLALALGRHEGLPVIASSPLPSGAPVLRVGEIVIHPPCAERLARLAVSGISIFGRNSLVPIYLRDPHITLPKRQTQGAGS